MTASQIGSNTRKNWCRRASESRVLAVAVGAVLVTGLGATGAVAAGLVTSADIKNGSVRGVDLAPGAVGSAKIQNGAVGSADLARNSVGSAQVQADAITPNELDNSLLRRIRNAGSWVGSNWGVVNRNVAGAGEASLRTGPTTNTLGNGIIDPPLGIGSLGVTTTSTGDRAAFGNEVAFDDTLVGTLTTLGFSVFTTSQNNNRGANNMPSITIEIDPNVGSAPGIDFAKMVYTPANGRADRWTAFDATDSTQGTVWTLTGAAGNTLGCAASGPGCTWNRIQDLLQDRDGSPATIFTLQITKGPGPAFSGAVDALRVRDSVFDFEPLGVQVR